MVLGISLVNKGVVNLLIVHSLSFSLSLSLSLSLPLSRSHSPIHSLIPSLSLFSAGLELFRSFLLSEHSDENIEFWIACENYKNCKSSKQLPSIAAQIYEDFVAVQSRKQVSFLMLLDRSLICL